MYNLGIVPYSRASVGWYYSANSSHTQTRQEVRRDLNSSDALKYKFRWNDKKIHMLDRLWLDGARAASVIDKIQKNRKLWAYVQDYLN